MFKSAVVLEKMTVDECIAIPRNVGYCLPFCVVLYCIAGSQFTPLLLLVECCELSTSRYGLASQKTGISINPLALEMDI